MAQEGVRLFLVRYVVAHFLCSFYKSLEVRAIFIYSPITINGNFLAVQLQIWLFPII